MTLPLTNPDEDLLADILPIVTMARTGPLQFRVVSVQGTGFLLGDGCLVTCWHCIEQDPPENHVYGAGRPKEPDTSRAVFLGKRQKLGSDLGWAPIKYRARVGLNLSTRVPKIGDFVWTFGYPLPQRYALAKNIEMHTLHPRVLRGHITRAFMFDHPRLGALPSWELSFPALGGLSGAPLFLDSTRDVVGVIYGNNDVATIEEESSVDPVTGARLPEIQRMFSFGLAHHSTALTVLAGLRSEIPSAELRD